MPQTDIFARATSPAAATALPNAPLLTPALRLSLAAALTNPERVQRLDVNGAIFWLKRPEQLSLRWRLQKGDPRAAFERERKGLHALNALGLPVPALVAEGADYLLIADGGQPLSKLLSDPQTSPVTRRAALKAAIHALHLFHAAGQAHGRPELRDMLWDGEKITLIDLERFGKTRNPRKAKILDMMIFMQACFAHGALSDADIEAVFASYQDEDNKGIYPAALQKLAEFLWLRPLVQLIAKAKPKRDILGTLRLLNWLKAQLQQAAGAMPAQRPKG